MEFSQSFNLGNSTFINLEKEADNAIFSNKTTEDNILEIVEESPTNKTINKTISRTGQVRLKSTSRKKHKWKKSKSDSDFKNENYSEFFKTDQSFRYLSSRDKSETEEQKVKGIEKNVDQNNVIQNIQKTEEEISAGKLDCWFDDSGSFSTCNKNASSTSAVHVDQAVTELVNTKDSCNDKNTRKNDIWEDSYQFENFVYTDNETSKSKLDSVINIEDSSFFCEENELQLKSILEDCKTDIEVFQQDSIQQLQQKSRKSSILETSKQSVLNITATTDTENFSTSEKVLLNWSVTSTESEVPKQENNKNDSHQPTKNLEELRNISEWNLPKAILKEYINKGIHTMFQWQVECLCNRMILFDYKNLVYSAPTSAGKTLISEILVIKTISERKKKALIILPFISVVREKMYYLQDLLTSSGYRVEGFFGGYTPPGGFSTINVAICTIEKANTIVNKLLEQEKLDDIGIIVIDEVHLISDPGRGYILELLLAKILYTCEKYGLKIQIVTMSATLPNTKLLQKWLNSELYITDFRPVELQEMIKIGNKIFDNKMSVIREIDAAAFKIENDQDHIAQLCIETILEGFSVIVFCPSKDWCENLCLHLASTIYKILKTASEIGEKLMENLRKDALEQIKEKLRGGPTGLDSILEKTLTYACAFHHAGLTMEERDIIETSFKNCILRIIVATSTLSSGVNLPARRVIIRSPLFGGKQMSSLTYKQMIGRAGRTGKDTLGESILICTENNSKSGKDLICADLKPLQSCLEVNNSTHLKRALLEVISSGVATTKDELDKFIKCTLLMTQKQQENDNNEENREKNNDPINDSLGFLLEYEFVRMQSNEETNEELYAPTRLGLACLSSSMPPGDGLVLFAELQKSRRCFVLESELHPIYLVTPYSVCYQMQDIDWLFYLDIWERLTPAMKKVGELVGVKESFLVRAMRGQTKLDSQLLQIHKRFYTALALQELVNEVPINKVAAKYKTSRGLLQSLQQMSSTFAGIVTSFCLSLNWTMLALIVSQFKERLFFGIHRELIDLMRIPELNCQRARALYNADIKNLIDLANADLLLVEKALYNCVSFDSAKKQDNEDDEEVKKRNMIRNFIVTGKTDISVKDAAKLLITDARKYLQYEIGVNNINWSIAETTNENVQNAEKQQLLKTEIQTMELSENVTSSQNSQNISTIPQIDLRSNRKRSSQKKTIQQPDKPSPPKMGKTDNENVLKHKLLKDKQQKCNKLESSIVVESPADRKKENTNNKVTSRGLLRRSPRNLLGKSKIDLIEHKNDKSLKANNKIKIDSNKDKNQVLKSKYSSKRNNLKVNEEQVKSNYSIKLRSSTSPKTSIQCLDSIQPKENISNNTETQYSKINKSKREVANENSASLEISDISFGQSLLKNPIHLNASHTLNTNKIEDQSNTFNCIHIIDVCKDYNLFKQSFDEVHKAKVVGLSVGLQKLLSARKPLIGANLLINQPQPDKQKNYDFICDDTFYIVGISIAIEKNIVLFVNLQDRECDDKVTKEFKLQCLENLIKEKDITLRIFDAKEQLKLLNKVVPCYNIAATVEDPKVANWLMHPDSFLTFNQMAQQHAPECSKLAELAGKGQTFSSIALNCNSSIVARVRCSVESCVTLHIVKDQIEKLEKIGNGELKNFFSELEMPIQISLFRMDSVGFPANESSLESLSQTIFNIMKTIEEKIYELHGSRFNLSSTAAVARILGLHKKPNGRYCTTKQILEKVDSPISNLILNYRKLNVILTKNIQPLVKCVKNDRIHGSSITFTSTGRISMQEPNLQNVAKSFEIVSTDLDAILISPRSPFCPGNDRCLISADFCQLEMRILTHLSQDPKLTEIMNTELDIFLAIAAKWNKLHESEVSEEVRNGTKQICYGIIYGMGIKSLADGLKCTEQEALLLSEQFHSAYPGIRAYIQRIVRYAKQHGFVETITGRRRYLDNINSSESTLRSQAERQAVNTTIQGSAADIAKSAILRMEKNLSKYQNQLKINIPNDKYSEVNFVLHLHDELIFEAPKNKARKIAKALKVTMENCVKLDVPLKVKLKIGTSWGDLKEINI